MCIWVFYYSAQKNIRRCAVVAVFCYKMIEQTSSKYWFTVQNIKNME